MLARMFATHWKNNGITEAWAVPLTDNVAGVKSVQTITVAGTATQAGTQPVYVHDDLIQVAVAVGDTAATVAGNIEAAILADLDLLCTASVAAAVVTVTANHKGADAGLLDIRTIKNPGDANVQGLTFTVATTTAGAGNPILTTAIANLGTVWFNHVTAPYTDATSMGAIDSEIDRRWGPTVQLETHAYGAMGGTVGALCDFGDTMNTMDPTTMGFSKSPTPGFIWAAELAAVEAYYRAIDPIRPTRGLVLQGVSPPAIADRFTWDEQQQLLSNGISTFDVDGNGNVIIQRDISMYRTNVAGQPDISYLDVGTILGLIYIRYTERAWVAQRFQRFKLGDDGSVLGPGSATTTPSRIKASIMNLAIQNWIGFVIGGTVQDLAKNSIYQRNSGDPTRVDSILGPKLLSALYIYANQIQFTQ